MAPMMSSPKLFGWEVMKRTHSIPGYGRDRLEKPGEAEPGTRVPVGVDVLAEELDFDRA